MLEEKINIKGLIHLKNYNEKPLRDVRTLTKDELKLERTFVKTRAGTYLHFTTINNTDI